MSNSALILFFVVTIVSIEFLQEHAINWRYHRININKILFWHSLVDRFNQVARTKVETAKNSISVIGTFYFNTIRYSIWIQTPYKYIHTFTLCRRLHKWKQINVVHIEYGHWLIYFKLKLVITPSCLQTMHSNIKNLIYDVIYHSIPNAIQTKIKTIGNS